MKTNIFLLAFFKHTISTILCIYIHSRQRSRLEDKGPRFVIADGDKEDELESVECFSVDSLDQERKAQRQSTVKDGYKQNGYKH